MHLAAAIQVCSGQRPSDEPCSPALPSIDSTGSRLQCQGERAGRGIQEKLPGLWWQIKVFSLSLLGLT